MIRQLCRPGIIVPNRGAIRPKWPYRMNRDSDQANGLVAWWPTFQTGLEAIDLARGQRTSLVITGGTPDSSLWWSDYQVAGFEPTHRYTQYVFERPWYAPFNDPIGGTITNASVAVWTQIALTGTNTGFPLRYGPYDSFNDHYCYAGTIYTSLLRSDRISITPLASLTDGQMTCVVCTKDGTSWKFYINGVLVNVTNAPESSFSSPVCRLGKSLNDTPYPSQRTADVRIYNRTLSAAEALQLYDPRTRWDLYYPIRNRIYSFSDAAISGYVERGGLFTPMTGF